LGNFVRGELTKLRGLHICLKNRRSSFNSKVNHYNIKEIQ